LSTTTSRLSARIAPHRADLNNRPEAGSDILVRISAGGLNDDHTIGRWRLLNRLITIALAPNTAG
jgi:hypothetical protein